MEQQEEQEEYRILGVRIVLLPQAYGENRVLEASLDVDLVS